MPWLTAIRTSRSCATHQELRSQGTFPLTPSRNVVHLYNRQPQHAIVQRISSFKTKHSSITIQDRSSLRDEVLASLFVDGIKRYGLAIDSGLYRSTGWYLQQSKLQNRTRLISSKRRYRQRLVSRFPNGIDFFSLGFFYLLKQTKQAIHFSGPSVSPNEKELSCTRQFRLGS